MSSTTQANLLIISLSLSLLLTACANEKYQAKPINQQQTTAKILAKDPLSADFKTYLIKQGYQEADLPLTSWGLQELTLSALYHHTKLDVAKAQLALANAQLETADQKQNPTLNGNLARSNQANGDARPWAYGLNIEIPIEIANKRQIKIEEAQHLVEVARIDVADTAWQLRSQLAKDLLSYHENMAQQILLQQEIDNQQKIVSMLEKRVALGVLSNTDLTASKLLLQVKKDALDSKRESAQEIRARLAADAGLSVEKFNSIQLRPLEIETTIALQTRILQEQSLKPDSFKNLQEKALLNRLDIRRGLEKYAAAEAKIKLEVAKQTPDISITPGFIFEFGDSIWSLGFSSLLNLLNKNQTMIAEATQLREIEGAQFETLQANIIADLSQANARYIAALKNLAKTKQQQAAQQVYSQQLDKQFAAGAIDRLALTQAALAAQQVDTQVLTAQFAALATANEIENMLQYPLSEKSVFPQNTTLFGSQ